MYAKNLPTQIREKKFQNFFSLFLCKYILSQDTDPVNESLMQVNRNGDVRITKCKKLLKFQSSFHKFFVFPFLFLLHFYSTFLSSMLKLAFEFLCRRFYPPLIDLIALLENKFFIMFASASLIKFPNCLVVKPITKISFDE